MQKTISLTNKYIVLATPLILYSLLSSVYLVVSASGGKIINLIFALILFFLMTAAFIAGWFYMIKLAVTEPEREDPNTLLKEFVSGIGEYFLPTLGSLFVMFAISLLVLVISYFVGAKFIGDPGVSAEALSKALQNQSALKAFVSGLSIEQLTKINLWNMLILGTISLNYFLFFLYMPALFLKEKNPFKAYFISLKDLFSKNILKTLAIFVGIFFLNAVISIFSTLFGSNVFLHFIITLFNFYFVTLVGVGVFYYYKLTFIDSNIGKNVDIEI